MGKRGVSCMSLLSAIMAATGLDKENLDAMVQGVHRMLVEWRDFYSVQVPAMQDHLQAIEDRIKELEENDAQT